MPAEFKKAIDLTLNNEKDTIAFLDDILIMSYGTREDHMNKLKNILDKLDAENMAISLDKSKFGCKQVEWLGYVINEYGTIPMQKKNGRNSTAKSPKNVQAIKELHGLDTPLKQTSLQFSAVMNPTPSIAIK